MRCCASIRGTAPFAAPAFGCAYTYTLPADPFCLRVLETWQNMLPWKVEGRKLVTDAGPPLRVRYIARITDPEQIDAALAQVIGIRLAATIAFKITQSRQLEMDLWKLYQVQLPLACSLNMREANDIGPTPTFIQARY